MRENYEWKLLQGNYEWKLSAEIITGNYQLVYQSRRKCEIYRDTDVSKNCRVYWFINISLLCYACNVLLCRRLTMLR